jgi:glycosyltransferase involved in cell wall biosynthesis
MKLFQDGHSKPERIVFFTPILDNYGAARTLFSIIRTAEEAEIPCEVWFPRDSRVDPKFTQSFSKLIVFRQMDLPVLRRKQVYELHFLVTLTRYFINSYKIRKATFSKRYSKTIFHVFTSASILGIFLVPRRNRFISVHEFSKNRFERIILKFLFLVSGSKRIFASNAVMKHYGIKGHVIHSGANIEDFKNFTKRLFQAGDVLKILCVGRITESKGQMIVLQALAELVNDHQNFNAVFVGAPFGKVQQYMDSCLSFVKSNGLDSKVEFVGERSDIHEYYQKSDVLIVPSIQPEAFGKVLVEGMASSNVVISTNIGGPLEIIQHEINGLFVSPNSVNQITETLAKVIDGDYDLKSITRNAKSSAKFFDEKDTGLKYLNFIFQNFC